jgi:hypothetical protein
MKPFLYRNSIGLIDIYLFIFIDIGRGGGACFDTALVLRCPVGNDECFSELSHLKAFFTSAYACFRFFERLIALRKVLRSSV